MTKQEDGCFSEVAQVLHMLFVFFLEVKAVNDLGLITHPQVEWGLFLCVGACWIV